MIIFIILSITLGILNYGAWFAYFQRKYPLIQEKWYKDDKKDAIIHGIICGIFFPAGLIALFTLFENFKYGFKWK